MISRSFYISDDEAFGVGTSSFSIDENEFNVDLYYDEFSELYFEDCEMELHF